MQLKLLKQMCNKNSQKLIDSAKKSGSNEIKTA